jgi:hypothetical protein
MRVTWEFVRAADAADSLASFWQWRLHAPEGSTTTSLQGFMTLEQCIVDARAHGYSPDAGDLTRLVDVPLMSPTARATLQA